LNIHRKVCNHPILINELLPGELKIRQKKDIIGLSGKLSGLVDLLKECGIIDLPEEEEKKTNKKQ
jgi:SNF2 family DNA or RNA helicase